MRSSTRHGGAPPTSAARAPHGTSPFPVTRVSQSRSAEDLSGARRSPSAARHPRHPGARWMRVADVLADDAGAQAGDIRPLREIHLRSRHSSLSAASNRSSLRAQHRRQDRRTGGRPDRRHCARSHSVTRPRSVTTVARGRPWSGGPAVRWVGDGAGAGRSRGGPQRPGEPPGRRQIRALHGCLLRRAMQLGGTAATIRREAGRCLSRWCGDHRNAGHPTSGLLRR
jgi:hypothetical protein